ncbi:MAG: aspartate--tRNA ligase [Chlamydiia bacterium]|nr:aspartate--tRNA ligase [Chlamydiia bacterium]
MKINYHRTHTCGQLRKEDVSKTVRLSGWVHRRRDLGQLIFIDLRDRYGMTQLVFKDQSLAQGLRSEDVITVSGSVIAREMPNAKMETGAIEIDVETLDILSKAEVTPFPLNETNLELQESTSLKYRYLDMRRGKIINNLRMRHTAMLAARNFFDSLDFTEVTTPILGKSTPEGARDYLVPSRIYPGAFYALPQSPQLFKQLLMVGGLDRYFQFATCFRDEDLRSDRQPEFMQIDIEMSFGEPSDIMQLSENLCKELFSKVCGIKIESPFPAIAHRQAMERYGTDRPDLRFDMPLVRIDAVARGSDFAVFKSAIESGGCVKALCVKGGLSRKEIENYTAFVASFGLKGLGWMKCEQTLTANIAKFFTEAQLHEIQALTKAEPGDTLLFAAADTPIVNQALDHLRRQIAQDKGLIDPKKLAFTWVTEFPLFAWDSEENRLVSEHHPFTAPHASDIGIIGTDPLKVRSNAYDLVLNGYEIAGGSQRIHDPKLQQQIFEHLKLSQEDIAKKFGFFVDALKYGTPPHLGIAFGFDRLMMILCQTDNIRDIIAFPKTIKASDLMMDAPAQVQESQLNELNIACKNKPSPIN